MINQSLEEQEMTINVYPRQVSPVAEVYTSIPHWANRLKKLHKKRPDDMSVRELDTGLFATVPLDWVKISPTRQIVMTEEQREARSNTMRILRRKMEEEKRNG